MWLRKDDMKPEYAECYFKGAREVIDEIYYNYGGFSEQDKSFFGLYIRDLGAYICGDKIKFYTRPHNAKHIIKFQEFMKWVGRKRQK